MAVHNEMSGLRANSGGPPAPPPALLLPAAAAAAAAPALNNNRDLQQGPSVGAASGMPGSLRTVLIDETDV
jgi:hypothetical protein